MSASPCNLVTTGLLAAACCVTAADAKELRPGGKLMLTNGITSIEGAAGGGLTPWAVVAGNATDAGIGLSAHATVVELKSYDLRTTGVSIGLFDRVELSYARHDFNTNEAGATLGIGADFDFKQDIFGAKVKLAGDLVYGAAAMPAIAVGMQYKKNRNGAVVRAIGATSDTGVDYYASASKLFLSRSVLAAATLRATKANQIGLLGFGGDKKRGYGVQVEGSVAWQLSRKVAVGGEFRTKPDNLSFAREDDWYDAFVTYAVNRHLTATLAYTGLGSIARVSNQHGLLFSVQASY